MKILTRKKEAEISELLDRIKSFEAECLRAVTDCTDALKEMQQSLVGANRILQTVVEMEARLAALEATGKTNA